MESRKILIGKIKRVLAKQPVRLAYLYGSFATGKARRGKKSDIDIAVVLERGARKADYQIATEIHKELGGGLPEIDVREINLDTEAVFLINTLRPAMSIFVKNERERVSFETKAYQKFHDTEHLRDISYFYLKKRIMENKYGFGIPYYQKIT